jgi:hypothetical protein
MTCSLGRSKNTAIGVKIPLLFAKCYQGSKDNISTIDRQNKATATTTHQNKKTP